MPRTNKQKRSALEPKRSIMVKHIDSSADIELDIGKAVAVATEKEFIFMEKMDNGKWRLTYSETTIKDFSNVKALEMERKN